MHEQFVEPSKRNADIIIPEGGQNKVAMDMVIERVQAHLNQSEKSKNMAGVAEDNGKTIF